MQAPGDFDLGFFFSLGRKENKYSEANERQQLFSLCRKICTDIPKRY